MVTGIIDHTRDEQGNEFTQGITVATLDPFRGYANAIFG